MARRVARALRLALLLACGFGNPGGTALAQPLDAGPLASPILTLDQERLFSGAGVDARVNARIEQGLNALADENRRIEADLVAQELELTELRATLPAEEFRARADAFDEMVQQVRAEQDAKEVALLRQREEAQQSFLRQITPLIAEIARERNALVVIDRRSAILSADAIDITDEAIQRIQDALDRAPEAPPETPPAPVDEDGGGEEPATQP